MKHNPKLHERVAALPGHARLHPLQDPARAQGALELMWQPAGGARRRSPGCRTSRCSRAPARTASWPGVLLTRAYHEDRGEQRTKVLTPDTAHGTNPATVTMAGYEVVKVGTDARRRRRPRGPAREGRRRRRLPDAHEPQHARAVRRATSRRSRAIVHGVGATLYYDGANLNAVMGITRPATWASTSCTSTCTSRSPSRTAAAGRARADRRLRPDRAVPAAPAGRAPRAEQRLGPRSTSTTTGRSRSASCAASRATSACSCAPTPTSARSAPTGCEDASRDRGAERQLPAGPAGARRAWPSTCRSPSTASACTSSCSPGAAMKRRARRSRRSTSPSGCSTTACTRRPSTSRCSSTRRCWSSRPRPRPQGAARRLRRGRAPILEEAGGPRDRPQGAVHDAR